MRRRSFARSVLAVCALAATMPGALAAELLDLPLGHSDIVRSPGEPAIVIIGDDNIADAALGSGDTIIVTGKAAGTTNMIVLDGAGAELMRSIVEVSPVTIPVIEPVDPVIEPVDLPAPAAMVRVIRGVTSEQYYACGPRCVAAGAPTAAAPAAAPAGTINSAAGGPCMYPDDIAADGTRCGDRAASVRPGGLDAMGQPVEAQ
jgi:Flp pilus assembly secretin CpaC